MEATQTGTERGSSGSTPSASTTTPSPSSSLSSRQRRLQQQQDQCSNNRFHLDGQRRHAREDWFNQWSHMWTKRQTPEWKPRRASVATCQQQQQPYHYKFLTQQYYELVHHFSLNTSPDNNNIHKHYSSHDQQGLRAVERLAATYCAQIKVNSDDSHDHQSSCGGRDNDDDDDDDVDGRNQQHDDELTREKKCDDDTKRLVKDLDQREAYEREYEPIVGPREAKTTTTTAAAAPAPATTATTTTTTTTTTSTNVSPRTDECSATDKRLSDTGNACIKIICKPANRNLSECGDGGISAGCGSCGDGDDNNHCTSGLAGDVSQVQRYLSASVIQVTDKSGRAVSESNRPSLDQGFCSNKPTSGRASPSSTCCSESSPAVARAAAATTTTTTGTGTTSTKPTTSNTKHNITASFNGPRFSPGREEFLNVAVSEKLQLQEKQRKYLILSMALKQMVAERDRNLAGGDSITATGSGGGGGGQDCSLCSCRSRSCSFGFASSSGGGRIVAGATVASPASSSSSTLVEQSLTNKSTSKGGRDQITEKESKMVLSSSRTMLIDKLNVERAAGLASSSAARNLLTDHQKIGGQLEMVSSSVPITVQRKYSTPDTCGKRFTSNIETKSQANNKVSSKQQTTTKISQQNSPTLRTSTFNTFEDTGEPTNTMRELIINQEARNNNNVGESMNHGEDEVNHDLNQWDSSNQNSPACSCELEQDTEEDDSEHSKDARGTWQLINASSSSASGARQDKSMRSQSVQSSALSEDLNAPEVLCCDLNLEALIVESWLDDHPAFVRDYFMRKANHQLIDDWLVSHAKISNTNLSSQIDLQASAGPLRMSRPNSQQSLSAPLRGSIWRVPDPIADDEFQSNDGHMFAFGRSARSNSQSSGITTGGGYAVRGGGTVTPVRKISATDFESRTGNGFLRPMLSTTPDGRLTFLSQPSPTIIGGDYMTATTTTNTTTTTTTTTTQTPKKQQHESDQSRRELANFNDRKRAQMISIEQETSDYKQTGKTNDACHSDGEQKDYHQQGSNNKEVTLGDGANDNYNERDDDDMNDELPPGDSEVKLIFELVKNICNDLDIRTLLHKILKNIAVLINADKSSLFLVCGQANDPNRHLVSQLFNVDQDSREVGEPDDSITIPWGTGLVGYVAESGESVNIANCYEDPRFTNAIDQRTGYVTKHMLCAPILDNRNEIVGVAQVINKRDGNPFTKSDEIKFKRYLQFCGIGLRNAQSYEHCQLENRRNQVLLDLARMIFEEQSTIEQVVYRIMLHTQSLLECERCQVLLIDDGSDDLDQLLKLPNSAGGLWQRNDDDDDNDDVTSSTSRPPEWKPQCQYPSSGMNTSAPDCDGGLAGNEEVAARFSGCFLANNAGDCDDSVDDVDDGTHGRCKQQQQQQQQCTTPSSSKLFSLVFDLECDGNDPVMHSNKNGGENQAQELSLSTINQSNSNKITRRFPINIGITSYVAMTGETLNIENAHEHERFDASVDEGSDFIHKSILCMPIRNGQRQIIGVSQLINKKNGRPFNKNDEDLFEAFAIFCGLGIHNTLMYERVLKIMAKQKVTFEVLSYHATAPLEEAKALSLQQIPSCFALNLASLKFNDFSLDDQYMLRSCLRFFLDLDLMRRFQIDQLVFCNWILSVQKNYRKVTYHPIVGGNGLKASPVRYHNWRHAFNVSQMMFAILVNTQICQALGELETLALLIACLCHDLDHRGTNNSFQIKSASPLAELYSTSTMEHHHFDQCVMILNSQGNQILANLSPAEYSKVIMLLEEAILATDLANYFQKRDLFFKLVNSNQFDWQTNPDHKSLLRCMLMTACDVAAITKPWPVQKVVADLVISEFYQQGDIEKNELNIQPIDMMNRDKMSELPEMQIGFIDTICAPIYTAFAKLFPRELSPLLDGCLANKNIWTEMANHNYGPDTSTANYLNDEINLNESPLVLPSDNNSHSRVARHQSDVSIANHEPNE